MGTILYQLDAIPYLTDTDNQNKTRYVNNYVADLTVTDETLAEASMPKCRVKRLWVNVITNGMDSTSYTLRKNQVDTGIVITSTSTGQLSATGDITYDKDDVFSIKIIYAKATAPATLTISAGGLDYGNY